MPIRAYHTDDFTAICDIYNRSKLDELKYETFAYSLLALQSDTLRFDKLFESEIYVYQENKRIAAYGAICATEIRALFVHPDFRRNGIGKQVLAFLLGLKQGPISLFVARSNYPAKSLYAQYGFKVTQTFETHYNQQPVVAQKMVLSR